MSFAGDSIALFLALVLLSAAVQKAFQQDRMAAAAARLAGTGTGFGKALAAAAGATEFLAAIALLFAATRPAGAAIAAALWLVYAVLLVRRRGEAFDCGCTFGAHAAAPRVFAPARALLFSGLAIAAALLPAGAWSPEPLFAALALFSLQSAAGELAAIPHPHWRHA
ncbi:MauE/DoxX family redox-associated membrane protein [Sphingosinicella soli]|uniref:Methylamine utilization protein MauE n=1 Tax=Sphingosinicella soli TaxID=333708 RepID=A0A7W7AZ24_9SPHN|nr:MauE/DoxX family redox-associated membrane protein [Sphingosinicella soli]MBB4630991.1 putative membrane protein YphA (DoxX/SURF4 family) [Sphingosinicella soli]